MHFLSDTSLDSSVDSGFRAIYEHKKTFHSPTISQMGKSDYIYCGFTQ